MHNNLPTHHNNEVDQTHKKDVFHHTISSLRKDSKQISAESSNSGSYQGKLLSRKSFPVSRGKSRTDVVERGPIFPKWEAPKNLEPLNYCKITKTTSEPNQA